MMKKEGTVRREKRLKKESTAEKFGKRRDDPLNSF